MSGGAIRLVAAPSSHDAGDVSLSVSIEPADAARVWDVTVVISRAADQPQIDAGEVDVRLLDAAGAGLTVVGRPSGPLVEAGGSLGVSANARFRFDATGAVPAVVRVTYRDTTFDFSITEAPGHGV